jgi:citrate lyase subunit beta / citryl-CoA lyase
MVEKALALQADGVILDLEDAVPPAEKDAARTELASALDAIADGSVGPSRIVRVNDTSSGRLEGDLEAVVRPGLDAVLVPKTNSAADVELVADMLTTLETRAGLPAGSVRILAAIESARGMHELSSIALAHERMTGLMFGAEDLALDLGLPVVRTGPGQELIAVRSALVLAAALARIQSLDQVWLEFHDLDGLRRDAVVGRQIGFTGKCVIHPSQIDIVNEVFSPTAAEVEQAEAVVAAFAEAQQAGLGVVMLGGQVVEKPIVERALAVLDAKRP